uniref:Hemoglobin n=1 Tax=Ditylenchus dipsaci TaxID=166011 RepID=A0A915D4Q6_9BILA
MSKENGIEYYKQLFTKHPDIAEAYGADGIEPDTLGHSHKFVMFAMNELQCFFQLPAILEMKGHGVQPYLISKSTMATMKSLLKVLIRQ